MNSLLLLAALTCSDWRLLPNGHWATVRATQAAGANMETIQIDDLSPGLIITHQGSGGDARVDLFDIVNKECGRG